MQLSPLLRKARIAGRRCLGRPVLNYQVLGERCSGTNFLDQLIQQNFAAARPRYDMWKHAFPNLIALPADVLYIVIFRDPFQWLESMYGKPWHSLPALRDLPFSQFIRAEWRSEIDVPAWFDLPKTSPCKGQPLNQDLHPITGAPFANLLALRRAKAEALLSLPRRGARVIYTTHAAISRRPEDIIARIADESPVPPNRRLQVPQGHYGWSWSDRDVKPKTPGHLITPEDRTWILSQLDPALEAAMGLPLDPAPDENQNAG
ncbi:MULTISPECIES: hypothetical protein [unclassified Phaeobacter]|uniref:hypothetical protein n=1 Tax=unclassified Phaeobacter TaxID=2621772 RepID=UPI003A86901C